MSLKTQISFYAYFSLALLSTGMSLVYILTPHIMPYHQEVLGSSWEALQPGYKLLFLSFMKIAGALALASNLAFFFLLFIPFRRGEPWARWAIPVFQFTSLSALNYVSINIAIKTSAHPPLVIFFIADALLLVGFIFSLDFGKSTAKKA